MKFSQHQERHGKRLHPHAWFAFLKTDDGALGHAEPGGEILHRDAPLLAGYLDVGAKSLKDAIDLEGCQLSFNILLLLAEWHPNIEA